MKVQNISRCHCERKEPLALSGAEGEAISYLACGFTAGFDYLLGAIVILSEAKNLVVRGAIRGFSLET